MLDEKQKRRRRSRPKRNDPQVNIRLPQELKNELRNIANKNGRSCNAEITVRLIESLEDLKIESDQDQTTKADQDETL